MAESRRTIKPFKPTMRFGWRPDQPDHRDFVYSAPGRLLRSQPVRVDLRSKCPPVYDQLRLGSCTANAIAGAVQFGRRKARQGPDFVPSRLFIYFNERTIEHSVQFDAGAALRDGIKSVAKQGVCPEAMWPYDDTHGAREGDPFPAGAPAATKPPTSAYGEAAKHQVVSYERLVQSVTQLKGCLASGYPFVFGFTVYANFFATPTQQALVTPMPAGGVQGGHAVMAVGYDDATGSFTCRNSWGVGQGDKGYFFMPYAYVTDPGLAADFWTIRTVES